MIYTIRFPVHIAGTAVLPFGLELVVCDGGIYTCVATTIDGKIHERNFSLVIGCKQ